MIKSEKKIIKVTNRKRNYYLMVNKKKNFMTINL